MDGNGRKLDQKCPYPSLKSIIYTAPSNFDQMQIHEARVPFRNPLDSRQR